jgi:gliding motility-associated-like protein
LNDYTLTVTLNGCQSSNTVEVTVNPNPVSNAGSPITLCAGQSGTIGVTSATGYSYSWLPTTNLSNATVSNPNVTGVNGGFALTNTVYTVTTTNTLTLCQSNGSVTVSVLPLPAVSVSTVQSVCEGVVNIPINGTIGGSALSGTWSGGSGTLNVGGTSLNGSYSPTAAEFTNGSVTLTLTAIAQAPCQNVSSTVTIGFYKKPVVNYTVDIPKGCPEHCVIFTDHSTISSPDFIQLWSWDFGDGGTSNLQNPPHCYSATGFYTVSLTATSNHLCSSQLIIPQMIEVYSMPIASFIPNPSVAGILDPTIDFQNTSQGAVSYFWDFGDYAALGATNTSTVTNPTHAYTYANIYNVHLTATSVNGCVDIVSASVEIKPEFTFYIPNCFTPESSDGVNDIFTGMGIGIEKYEMWIFDRWGANIFYSDDIYKGWNGKVAGKSDVVQQDVYIWKVKLKDVFDKRHEYIGHVTLLK